MKKSKRIQLIVLLLVLSASQIIAQNSQKLPTFSFANGVGIIAPDSLFSVNFRFRTQLRASYFTQNLEDLSMSAVEARVRRMRLRFEGFMLNPKVTYYIQLSFSRGDMDWFDNDNSVVNSSPNVVRDAIVTYKPNQHWLFVFGQTKLPGNRQRVVSSGELQFADRSIVNNTFTIDRDFGFHAYYFNQVASVNYALKGVISTGEGRNSSLSAGGLAYTGRLEILPLGNFSNKGDYFEGDLEREPKPKIAFGAGYHYNEGAERNAGTIGRDLYERRNMSVFFADFLLKYKGFAFSAEYMKRNADQPITMNSDGLVRAIYVGDGSMAQLSYLFKNNIELAGRYAITTPDELVQEYELQRNEVGAVVTKYFRKHRVKLQTQVFYLSQNTLSKSSSSERWNAMFQIEIGI